jgi:hypothetical protein
VRVRASRVRARARVRVRLAVRVRVKVRDRDRVRVLGLGLEWVVGVPVTVGCGFSLVSNVLYLSTPGRPACTAGGRPLVRCQP